MKHLKYRFAALLLCLGLLCAAALAANTGSLSIHLTDSRDMGGAGVDIGLFSVGDKDGNLTVDFAGSGLPAAGLLDEKKNPANAKNLLAYAREEGLDAQMTTTDSQGKVFYPDLAEGVYLVFGSKGEFAPYLVYIPTKIGSLTVYDVKSEPKTDEEEDPDDPPGPSGSPSPSPSVTPGPSDPPGPTPGTSEPPGPSDPPGTFPTPPPSEPGIPQTGARTWPMYLLLGTGILLSLAGAIDLYRGRKDG